MLELLLQLKKEHGDMNAALVRAYLKTSPDAYIAQAARDTGLSRSAVRRVLFKKDRKVEK